MCDWRAKGFCCRDYLEAHTLPLFEGAYFLRQQILTIKLGILKKG